MAPGLVARHHWGQVSSVLISVTASFMFGVFFLWKGMTGWPG
jgi:hypothetical protein